MQRDFTLQQAESSAALAAAAAAAESQRFWLHSKPTNEKLRTILHKRSLESTDIG